MAEKESHENSEVHQSATTTALPPHKQHSDPGEDDLDDLDDLLDDFSATKVHSTQNAANPPSAPPAVQPPEDPDISDQATHEFSKQLQEQMAALLGNVDETPEMRQEIEAMMQELGAAADTQKPAPVGTDAKRSPPLSGENDFQETIRRTMERMQNSGEQASAAAAAADDSDDILAQLMKETQPGSSDGSSDEEGISKMLMGMMEQLTNKEILYEPMKELHDKFPEWMRENKNKVSKDDLKRYENQQRYVSDIVAKFDEEGYSDSKPAERQYIIERMQQMQAAGSPPPDLVRDMNGAQEGLGNLDAGCPQQ